MTSHSDPPPSYNQAVGLTPHDNTEPPSSLPHQARNDIPPSSRRSMEDELRPLPAGWVRQFDADTQHQFFVDTTASPPRSIWHHPYDDEVYLDSLPAGERDRVRRELSGLRRSLSVADLEAEDTESDASSSTSHKNNNPQKGEENNNNNPPGRRTRLARLLKDRLTNTTHAQRAATRARRAAAERDLYTQHRVLRKALLDAVESGQPQPLGRDEQGRELFLEPPGVVYPGVVNVRRLSPYWSEVRYADGEGPGGLGMGMEGRYLRPEGEMYGGGVGLGGMGMGTRGVGMGGGLGYPGGGFVGSRFHRPGVGYARAPGRGYGGGLGMPLVMPVMGGVMLGGMMGSAAF
ncbi:hypothetical protein B0J18DRAFT_478284 [Chaetomium sp. MPI-SDFR-AT-0129]|nr:hypothetical protein B0J18DRAFT_478284 [Chaetomium sp. MPI-SDFR-AT-0129]